MFAVKDPVNCIERPKREFVGGKKEEKKNVGGRKQRKIIPTEIPSSPV